MTAVLPPPSVPVVAPKTGLISVPWYQYIHENDLTLNGTATGGLSLAAQVAALQPVEGSWTPNLEFGGSNAGITYSKQIGRYIKNSNLITVWASIVITSVGSATGLADLSGLPFPASNVSGLVFTGTLGVYGGMDFFGSTNPGPFPHSAVLAGESVVRLYDTDGTVVNAEQITNNWFTATSSLSISVTYRTG